MAPVAPKRSFKVTTVAKGRSANVSSVNATSLTVWKGGVHALLCMKRLHKSYVQSYLDSSPFLKKLYHGIFTFERNSLSFNMCYVAA